MSMYPGTTDELVGGYIGNDALESIYVGDELIWPMENDFIAFRYYRYGASAVQPTPPYEIGDIMAHNWSSGGTWYQNLVVFQFTDTFFNKKPYAIFGNNGYYQDDSTGSRVAQGTLYRFNNTSNLTMQQVYERYSYSNITNYCTQIATIPAGKQFFNIVVSGNFVKGGIYVIKLPDYSSGTYASCGLYHWNQVKFPCLYTRTNTGDTGYNLLPQMGWLTNPTPPVTEYKAPSRIIVIFDQSLVEATDTDYTTIPIIAIGVVTNNESIAIVNNKTIAECLNASAFGVDIPEGSSISQIVIIIDTSRSASGTPYSSVITFNPGFANNDLHVIKCHKYGTILRGGTEVSSSYDWNNRIGKTAELYFTMAPTTSALGEVIEQSIISNSNLHDMYE